VRSILNPGNQNAINATGSNGSLANNPNDLEAKPLMRGEDGEFEDTRGKNNR
jgi:hypothetical protein